MSFIFCLFLLILLNLYFVNLAFYYFPAKLLCFSSSKWLYYVSRTKVSQHRLIVALEYESETIFLVWYCKIEHSINAGKLLFIMVVPNYDVEEDGSLLSLFDLWHFNYFLLLNFWWRRLLFLELFLS